MQDTAGEVKAYIGLLLTSSRVWPQCSVVIVSDPFLIIQSPELTKIDGVRDDALTWDSGGPGTGC